MVNKRKTQYIVNIIVMFLCISIVFIGTSLVTRLNSLKAHTKADIQKEWRNQAKRTLTSVQAQFQSDITNGLVDVSDEYSLQQWAKRNIGSLLNGGATGDAFMINLTNEKFIWDGSRDCARPQFITNGRYMSDESSMHVDKDQAELMLDKMRLGYSTLDSDYNYWWNFDGSPEYLEWIVIPPGKLGFNDEPETNGGVFNPKYSKILICLGTQEDEVQSTFMHELDTIDSTISYIDIFLAVVVIICIFNMIIYVYFNKRMM